MKFTILKATFVTAGLLALSLPSSAEDWTISATEANCDVVGNVVKDNGGWKASGGTAIVSCGLTKKVQNNTFNNIWVRS